jgi:SRSO17 transposase
MSTNAMWKAVKARLGSDRRSEGQPQAARAGSETGTNGWLRLDDFAEGLSALNPSKRCLWPSQEGEQRVWAHLIQTRIKKLGVCQVLIVRPTADAPVKQTRFYITTRLEDTLEQVVQTMAKRWTVETLFADFKELMGSDHYQLRSAEAIRRFWALGLCLYQYLDSLRHRLEPSPISN